MSANTNFFATSPFTDRTEQNKTTVQNLCQQYGIEIPPEGQRHFLSHLDEVTPLAIEKAFSLFEQSSITAGVHTFVIDNPYLAVTRLCGPKVGDKSLIDEERTMHYRGEDRPLQPVVIRQEPYRRTNKITLIVFPNKEGKLTLCTMHSGDSMPISFEEQEWKDNALAFRKDEIKSA